MMSRGLFLSGRFCQPTASHRAVLFRSVLDTPLLLSDSHLHLFLQSELSVPRMERCARGETRYSVAEAIQRSSGCLISSSFPLDYTGKGYCDSDCER